MAVKHKNYLSIPTARRKATASKSLTQLREALGNPTLTEDQRSAVIERIERVNKWAAGTLPSHEHHVEISESVDVEENT
jgi:hypothetical protein